MSVSYSPRRRIGQRPAHALRGVVCPIPPIRSDNTRTTIATALGTYRSCHTRSAEAAYAGHDEILRTRTASGTSRKPISQGIH